MRFLGCRCLYSRSQPGFFSRPAASWLYVLIRYRHRATDPDYEPAQIYGSKQIELSWTVIPVLIVVVLFLTTARVIFNTEYAQQAGRCAGCHR